MWANWRVSAPGYIDWVNCAALDTRIVIFYRYERLASWVCGVIMGAVASQINGVSIVCSTVCSNADQRRQQSSASLAFVRGIHRWPVISPVTSEFSGRNASYAENVSIWWRHHAITIRPLITDTHMRICPALMISMPIDVLALCNLWLSEGIILTTGFFVFCCTFSLLAL